MNQADKESKFDLLWFPFEKEQIETSLSLDMIEGKLKENIEKNPPILSFYYSGTKVFKGELKPDYFKISRIIKHRNSFLPVIEGELVQSNAGSKVLIKYRLNYFVLVFWVSWIIFTFMGSIVSLFGTIVVNANFIFVVPLFLLTFGYFLGVALFSSEVTKAKKLLRDIFDV